MSSKTGGRDVAVLGLVGAAVCCGLPVLLAVAGGLSVAGIGFRSWLLVAAGVVVCLAGALRWRQHVHASRGRDADGS
jgi:hypothetical protein